MRRSRYFVCVSAYWSSCCRIQCQHIFLGPEDIQHLGQASYTHFVCYRKQLPFIPTAGTLPQVHMCPAPGPDSVLPHRHGECLSVLTHYWKIKYFKITKPTIFFYGLGYLAHPSTSHYYILTFYISHLFISTGVGFVNVLGRTKKLLMANLQKLTVVNRNMFQLLFNILYELQQFEVKGVLLRRW